MTNLSDLFKPQTAPAEAQSQENPSLPQFEFIQEEGPSLAALMLEELKTIDEEIKLKLKDSPTLDNYKQYTIISEATKACRDVIDRLTAA